MIWLGLGMLFLCAMNLYFFFWGNGMELSLIAAIGAGLAGLLALAVNEL